MTEPLIRLRGLRKVYGTGDLAVEAGFSRLAEVQEEILWIAEAAHAPVIWATQVLEGMARRGAPARAEVTDAAMSAQPMFCSSHATVTEFVPGLMLAPPAS